ncbi:nucleoside hydrolase [Mesorhizobium sp. ORM8.1]
MKKVVAMGGAYTRGNITPAAEFNVYGDPEAADVVFRADWDVTMVGLDLTHQALATPDLQDRVRAVGGPMAKFILDIWEFIATTHGGLLQIEYPAIHDACCVAAMIDPTVFTIEKADIRVEIAGRWTKGMTVCNFEKMGGMHHFGGTASEQVNFRHNVAMKLDHAKFCDLVVDALERLVRGWGEVRGIFRQSERRIRGRKRTDGFWHKQAIGGCSSRRRVGEEVHDVHAFSKEGHEMRRVLEQADGSIDGMGLSHNVAAEKVRGASDAVPGNARRVLTDR